MSEITYLTTVTPNPVILRERSCLKRSDHWQTRRRKSRDRFSQSTSIRDSDDGNGGGT
jgi:hypothetical protein